MNIDANLIFLFPLEQIIFEGIYALHPDIRRALDLWIAVVRTGLYFLCNPSDLHFFLNLEHQCLNASQHFSNRLEAFIHI